MKYFILGGLASAFFLYGIALLYGGTRTTSLTDMVTRLQSQVNIGGNDALVLAGLALMLIGFAFKVSAVPFHVWSPDVYQGAPSNITAFMASVGRWPHLERCCGYSHLLCRFIATTGDRSSGARRSVAHRWFASCGRADRCETNACVFLVSHAGFILVGLEATGLSAGENAMFSSVQSVAVYLGLYSVLVVGSFAVIGVAGRGGDTRSMASTDCRVVARRLRLH